MIFNPSFRMGPCDLESPSGLTVQVNANGSIRRIKHRDILINLFLGNEVECGPANIYLRRLGDQAAAVPLLGRFQSATKRTATSSMTMHLN
jgi:1,2-beta-oligoglucan phosphorylase